MRRPGKGDRVRRVGTQAVGIVSKVFDQRKVRVKWHQGVPWNTSIVLVERLELAEGIDHGNGCDKQVETEEATTDQEDVMSTAEPSVNDLSPMSKAGPTNLEPAFLLDTSGSMSYPTTENGSVVRMDLVREALPMIVAGLEKFDAQAAKESEEAGDEEGGVMTVTFASDAAVIGDLNSANLQEKFRSIKWGGGTNITPGWNLVLSNYMEEFGDEDPTSRPALLCMVITDGEASDEADFEAAITKAKGGTYVCVAVVGYGPEHDKTMTQYQKIAAANNHVRVLTFADSTNPQELADGLLAMFGG